MLPPLPAVNEWEIHPMLVHFPIAFLWAAVALDLFALGRPRETATRAAGGLYLAGVIAGWITAAAGFLAYFTIPAHTAEAHLWLYWHLGFALAMLLLFTWLASARWRSRHAHASRGQWLAGLLGVVLLTITGYFGGISVYHGGAGIAPHLLTEEVRHHHEH